MRKSEITFNKIALYVLSVFILVFLGCNHCISEFHYTPPENIKDGLNTGTLESVGIDSAIITKGIKKILCGKFNEVHSMLIYKDGLLVLEQYFPGHIYQWNAPYYFGEFIQWDRNRMHWIMSCTKSITSACIGIAIDQGHIRDVHQSIFDYLPDYQQFKKDGKQNITVEHLLNMTSGLEWNEWSAAHGTSANDIDRLYFECSDDPVKCVLERALVNPPGEVFNYCGGNTVILGEILRNATQMNIDDFSKQYLFQPLGIDSTVWVRYNNGVFATDGTLQLTPRDMLKFGVMYLNKGTWNDERILSEDWVAKSATPYGNNTGIKIPIEDSGRNGYSFSWWISELPYKKGKTLMYRANGWGGQTIMVIPELDMVIVFTSGNYAFKSSLFKLIRKYVMPAID
jgi:CubicO group peptidase (beta-lactamase class C family)